MKQFYILFFTVILCNSLSFSQSGNGNSGFGGPLGLGSLSISDDGTTINCTFTKGLSGNFNDTMVMYISTGVSGRNAIDGNVNDLQDANRRAISNAGSGDLTFPSGFEATHAIAINTGFSGLWSILATGSLGNNGLTYIDTVVGTFLADDASFIFSFDWNELGLANTDSFGYVITYGNPNDNGTNMFSSDEAVGGGIGTGNPGLSAFSYSTYYEYPSGSIGGTATTNSANNWSNSLTWTNGNAPLNSDAIFVNHNVAVDIDGVAGSVEINAPNTLTLNAGKSLTINGALTNNGSIALNSTSTTFSSIIPGSVSGSGTVTYNRWVNADANSNPNNNGRDLISAPFSGQTFNTFYGVNSGNLVANAGTVLFGPFDNSAIPGVYVNYLDSATDALVAGKGYRAATTGASGTTLAFDGSVNTGQVDVLISDYGDTNFGRWNLIGNPYPSYINFIDFYNANKAEFDAGVFQSIYGYDSNPAGTGGIWTIWNNLNFTDKIAPGQAFFVKCKAIDGVGGTTTVSFTASTRTTGTNEDFITDNRQAEAPAMAFAKIDLNSANANSQTDIYFVEGTTRGLDPGYDAGNFGGGANGFSIYTNLVEDNTGEPLAIQALPYEDMNNVVVPVGINADQGVQISIGLNDSSTIPGDINIFLEDNVANTWTLLNTGDYVFTPSTNLNGTGRFFLHFTTGTLSVEDADFSGLQIYSDNGSKTVFVNGQLETNTTAFIYDLQGRMVLNQALSSSSTTNTINVNSLSSGLYIVELRDFIRNRTQKVIIK